MAFSTAPTFFAPPIVPPKGRQSVLPTPFTRPRPDTTQSRFFTPRCFPPQCWHSLEFSGRIPPDSRPEGVFFGAPPVSSVSTAVQIFQKPTTRWTGTPPRNAVRPLRAFPTTPFSSIFARLDSVTSLAPVFFFKPFRPQKLASFFDSPIFHIFHGVLGRSFLSLVFSYTIFFYGDFASLFFPPPFRRPLVIVYDFSPPPRSLLD